MIKESDIFSATLLKELLVDIDFIIQKAKDGLRGREGSPAVRAFLKEVKEKVSKMLLKIKDKETRKLVESAYKKIEEAMSGSFSDIENKVRDALRLHPAFPSKDAQGQDLYIGPYIEDIYPEHVVVKYDGRLYDMAYSLVDQAVVFGAAKEVQEQYIPVAEAKTIKEAELKDLKESGVNEMHVEFVSLQEAKFNADFSEVEVVLVEAGCNEMKKRYYPDKTIREAAPIFSGWKMYINHPTEAEEKSRPERNLRDWASTIVESRYENGKAMGRVAIHDSWLRERLADPVARQHIGLSILTGGKISVGSVNGKDGYQIVEAIIPARKNGPCSVDWVTEPGARGRVSKLLESNREVGMELENATLKDLKESRKDLVESILKESSAGNADKVAQLEKELKEANAKIAASEKNGLLAKQVEIAESFLKDKKLPEASKERILDGVKANVIEGDIKEAITKLVETELAYVNKLVGKGKVITNAAGEGAADLMESLQKDLDTRAGIKEIKKE